MLSPGRAIGWGAVLVSTAILAGSAFRRSLGDLSHYHRVARAVAEGASPYTDAAFEYPPYALAWLLWPSHAEDARTYAILLSLSFLAWHLCSAVLVLREGERLARVPWNLVAVLTVAALPILQSFWYLRRFDVVPAALTLLAVVAAARSRPFAAGLAMAAGALMKLFPLLIAPALISAAIRTRTVRELSWGVCAGVAPAAVLLLAWPWWRFADLHASRGLQVESLAASVLWLGRHLWSWDVQWVGAAASYEIAGDPAALVLTWARVPWILSLAASAAVAAWSVRGHEARSAPALARAALLPVLAFVAFSPVISPQFMIWLQLLAAMVLLDRPRLAAGVILLAAAVTPLVYPSESYRHGLDVIRTVILLARNLALVLGWGLLMREALRREQSDEISGGDGRDAVTR